MWWPSSVARKKRVCYNISSISNIFYRKNGENKEDSMGGFWEAKRVYRDFVAELSTKNRYFAENYRN